MRETTDFDILFRTYYEPLYRFANQYIRDEAECHDIVSAVFETVWLQRDRLRPDTARAFLYANVRNRCIDLLRHQRQQQRYVDYVAHQSQQYIEERAYEQQQEREVAIQRALGTFDAVTQKIFRSCLVDGKKYKEVADDLGISLSMVKKRMTNALKLLRERQQKAP